MSTASSSKRAWPSTYPPTPGAKPAETPFQVLLKPCTLMLKISLLYQCESLCRSRIYTFVSNLLAVVLIVLSTVYVASELRRWNLNDALAPSMAFTVTVTVWSLQALFCLVYVVYWQRSGQLARFNVVLLEATGQDGCKACFDHMKRILNVTLAIILVFWVVTLGFVANVLFIKPEWIPFPEIFERVFFFDHLEGLQFVVMVYMMIAWSVVILIALACCGTVMCEFGQVNGLLDDEPVLTAATVRQAAEVHSRLTAATEFTSAMLGTFLLSQFVTAIPLIVFLVFALFVTQAQDFRMTAISVSWLVASAVQLYGLTYYAALINVEATKAPQIIRTKFLRQGKFERDIKLSELVSWFSEGVGISVRGFFLISKAMILTVSSVLLTYAALMIQTRISAPTAPTCNCTVA